MKRKQRNWGKQRNRGARSQAQDRVLFFAPSGIDRAHAACVVCAVDDTDDVTGDISTGYVAECIADCVGKLGGEVSLGITRHQLLLSDDVAYTSHNSAMCFVAFIPDELEVLAQFRACAVEAVCALSVEAADPGLCIAVFHPAGKVAEAKAEAEAAVQRAEIERGIAQLHEFGRAAQTRVCTKEEAYQLAAQLPFVELSEHGGSGLGIIGALAGVGLRLGGSDGRFRGKWNLVELLGAADVSGSTGVSVGSDALTGFNAPESSDALMAVDEFCKSVGRLVRGRVAVVDDTGAPVDSHAKIHLVREAKPIFYERALTFVVDADMHPAEKVDLGGIGAGSKWKRVCERFALDNDVEECAPDLERSCRNCLYRRWTESGFTCVAM